MCGIFGGIGRNVNPGTIRALALVNRERGTDSIGFFSSDGAYCKIALDPLAGLAHKDIDGYIVKGCTTGWFVAGHTRYATTGEVTSVNAHPFQFGSIIGAHNGMVRFPYDRKYQVDSEYLFDQLNRHNGDYQTAFADINGYWGLSWFDGEHFYLQAHDNTIAYGQAADGTYYYSSDEEHLAACLGSADNIIILRLGETIRFDGATLTVKHLPEFRSSIKGAFNTSLTATQGGAVKTKKRKKRKNRKEAKDSFWLGSDSYSGKYGLISAEELTYCDDLADQCGYGDFHGFMAAEGFASETEAMNKLENAAWEEWNDDADKANGTDWSKREIYKDDSLFADLSDIAF